MTLVREETFHQQLDSQPRPRGPSAAKDLFVLLAEAALWPMVDKGYFQNVVSMVWVGAGRG